MISIVHYQVGPRRADGIDISWTEPHILIWFAEEEPDVALDYIERVLHVAVVVPGHFLRR